MNLDDVPGDLVDEMFGDHNTRVALERSTAPKLEIEFMVPDTPGCSDSSDIVVELERSELVAKLTGLSAGANDHVATPGALHKRDSKGRRWLSGRRCWSEPGA